MVTYYRDLFNKVSILQEDRLIDDVIPQLMNVNSNNILNMLPTQEEIHNSIMRLDKDSAPCPNGFSGLFFQTFWEITKDDVVMVVT